MKRIIILITATLLFAGITLQAQKMDDNRGENGSQKEQRMNFNDQNKFEKDPHSPFERMEYMLKLSDEQSAKISNLRFKNENLALDTRNEIQKNRLVIRKMMSDKKIDQIKLLQITDENSKLQSKIKASKVKMWLDIYNLLDDTQKGKWINTFEMFSKKGGMPDKGGKCGHENDDLGWFQKRKMR